MKIRLIQEHDFWRWVLKVLKGQENLLLKILQVKTCIENVRFLSWRIFFVGKYGIQSTNEMAFKRIVTLRASFRFPAIRFDAPTLLSFSGFTHAHAKCPPVGLEQNKMVFPSCLEQRGGVGVLESEWDWGEKRKYAEKYHGNWQRKNKNTIETAKEKIKERKKKTVSQSKSSWKVSTNIRIKNGLLYYQIRSHQEP